MFNSGRGMLGDDDDDDDKIKEYITSPEEDLKNREVSVVRNIFHLITLLKLLLVRPVVLLVRLVYCNLFNVS